MTNVSLTTRPSASRVLRQSATDPYRTGELLMVERDGRGGIWSHVRQRWITETPEERVRQEYLCVLVNEYGFGLDQIAEEEVVTGRGSAQARADFIIWRSVQDEHDRLRPLIVVECKSDNVTIRQEDYAQGDNYARIVDARFVVTHNNRETKYWRAWKDRMPGYLEEVGNIPAASATDRQIEELLSKLGGSRLPYRSASLRNTNADCPAAGLLLAGQYAIFVA